MTSLQSACRSLANVFGFGQIDEETMVQNASAAYFNGGKPRWLRPLARHLEAAFEDATSRPLVLEIAEEIAHSKSFVRSWNNGKVNLGTERLPGKSGMVPGKGNPQTWKIPPATSLADLARLLELHLDDLGWLCSQSPLTKHYYLQWHTKQNPARSSRLIEIPKPLLKETQRSILQKILLSIPVHESATAFQPGKSILQFVEPHLGKSMVLKLDFSDFFPTISSGRVFRFFMTAGYPETVAGCLADLCTNAVDYTFLQDSNLDQASQLALAGKHLPQGAPTSPALANLCSFRLDCRLAGLARSVGAHYTRYADDLLFSGVNSFRRQAERFHLKVLTIAIEEGFRINTRKTRFMHQSQRQSAAGLVFNDKPNLARREYDLLKAIVHNCIYEGWESQNRENHPDFRAHLKGRIGWVAQSNPARAEKLIAAFERIDWE